jgi:hypothetical protein
MARRAFASSPRAALCLLVLAAALPAAGAEQVWRSEPDTRLATLRGGFTLQGGPFVSFGIARTVLIDGQVALQASLHIPDVRAMTGAQAQQLAEQVTRLGWTQVGPNNGTAGQLPGVVVQNTENNRHIQSITELNAVSNGMGLLKGLNLSRTVDDALGAALGR